MNFRSKTRKAFSDKELNIIEGVITEVIKKPKSELEEILWKLTYKPFKTLKEFGLDSEFKPEEVILIRGEISNQYRLLHPEWEYAKKYMQEPYKTELSTFRSAISTDETILYAVMQKISYCVGYMDNHSIGRTIYLLRGRKATLPRGGLRAIGFSNAEVNFLETYAKGIADVLEKARIGKFPDIHHKSKTQDANTPKEISSVKPVESQDDRIEQEVKSIDEKKENRYLTLFKKREFVRKIYARADELDEEYDKLDEEVIRHFKGVDVDWFFEERDEAKKTYSAAVVRKFYVRADKLDEEYDKLDEAVNAEFEGIDLDIFFDKREEIEEILQAMEKIALQTI